MLTHVNLVFRGDGEFSLYMMLLTFFLLHFFTDLQEASKL